MLLSFLTATPCLAGDFCQNVTLDQLNEQVPIPPATIISKREVNDMCEVILNINGQYVPVYAGKDYVIAGEMFENKQQVTQSKIDNLKAENFVRLMPEIDKCVSLTYKPEVVKQTVYMITDPVCPFCHSMENSLQAFAEKNHTEFKLILYSVHPPVGRQKSVEAVCRNLTAEQYVDGKWQEDNKTAQYQCQTGINKTFETEQLMAKLGINGVPMFLFPDGQTVQGADITALEKVLSAKDSKPEKTALEK